MSDKTVRIIAEPGIPQVIVEREFDAPRSLLFRAWTDPELLKQWLGPRNLTMRIDRYEVRDGGTWRYVHTDPEGNEFAFHGVFHGDPSEDGMVQTFEFEGYPGHVSMDTLTFEERDGKTLVRTNSVFQTVEARDGMVESGMGDGMEQGYERLDELIAKLAPVS